MKGENNVQEEGKKKRIICESQREDDSSIVACGETMQSSQ
jgi:hypothetical protein